MKPWAVAFLVSYFLFAYSAWKEEGVDSGGAGGNVKLRELVSSLVPSFSFDLVCWSLFFFLCNEQLPWLLCSSTVMQDHSQ